MDSGNPFWDKVDKSGGVDSCWVWTGALNANGYGSAYIDGKRVIASRHALSLKLGRAIRPGFFACHTCDNPPCVNPAHLWEGTQSENMRDCSAKNRNKNKAKAYCKNGHELAGENLRLVTSNVKRPERRCISCDRITRRDHMRRYRAALKAEQTQPEREGGR